MPSHYNIKSTPNNVYRLITCTGWFDEHAHPRHYFNNEFIWILILGIVKYTHYFKEHILKNQIFYSIYGVSSGNTNLFFADV